MKTVDGIDISSYLNDYCLIVLQYNTTNNECCSVYIKYFNAITKMSEGTGNYTPILDSNFVLKVKNTSGIQYVYMSVIDLGL